MELPREGTGPERLLTEMRDRRGEDADWHGGETWSLVYHAGDDVDDVARAAHDLFLFENALNPAAFPSLRRFEREIVSMTAGLLSHPEASGSLTSGGSESILLAVKTARDHARAERGVTEPEMIAPLSAHPAFDKAAHFVGVRMIHTPLRDDYRADVDAVADAMSERTVLVVGAAPGYPHGVIDPIPELAALAADRGILFHVDGCLGGFMLPFWERLGHPVPPFDFRVDGVTSMTADVHKYGYAPKGASVLLHGSREQARYQAFVYEGWPGGIYGTRGVAGARGGGPIAAAWAVMRYLGEAGYLRLAEVVRDTTRELLDGIGGIPALEVVGVPDMSVFSFTARQADIFAVGDAMDDRGWRLDRQQLPDALHCMVTPNHAKVVGSFLADLREAAHTPKPSRGTAARYAD